MALGALNLQICMKSQFHLSYHHLGICMLYHPCSNVPTFHTCSFRVGHPGQPGMAWLTVDRWPPISGDLIHADGSPVGSSPTRHTPGGRSAFYLSVIPFYPFLVGGLNPSEKWWSSSVGMMKFPIYGKITFMFQTTNQFLLVYINLIHIHICIRIHPYPPVFIYSVCLSISLYWWHHSPIVPNALAAISQCGCVWE